MDSAADDRYADGTTLASDQSASDERGYVLATTALLLIPLMIFAALAVDVGGWYSQTTQIQRAADAASLAAVVYMPNEQKATTAALQVAAANGFTDQPGCDILPCAPTQFPQVVVSKITGQQVRVDIYEEGETYFGGVVISDEPDLHRFSSAEFILPVPMGNPTSAIGMGADMSSGLRQNFYLRADSECQLRQFGDFIGAGGTRRNIQTAGAGACPIVNPNYRAEGHTFIVDIPTTPPTGGWELQARATCFDLNGSDPAAGGARNYPNKEAAAPIRLRLFDKDDTLLNDNDNVAPPKIPLSEVIVDSRLPYFPGASAANTPCDPDGNDWSAFNTPTDPAKWVPVHVMTEEGRYILQAKNPSGDGGQRATYSLRVVPTGTPSTTIWSCTRIGPSANTSCPNVYAKDWLTVYSHNTMLIGGPNLATLYLAEIGEIHAGKKMEVTIFDPADGIDSLRILNPQGQRVPVPWYGIDCPDYNYACPTPGGMGTAASPVVQSCGGVPCVKQATGVSFQDRTIRITIDLPNNPADMCVEPAGEPANCWWQVEYEDSDGQLGEATTWGVRIIGDPVRLTE